YRIESPEAPDAFKIGGQGGFLWRPYVGANPLYANGPLAVSADGTHLEHRDGTPFFWLADTVWNGTQKAELDDWQGFLVRRREQGFTMIQAVLAEWRTFFAGPDGEPSYYGRERIHLNPTFFRRQDQHVAAIAHAGLVPCLVLLWELTERDPGHYLPEADAIALARYLVARYGAYRAVWFLGGDGRYQDPERWKRIGRAVFGDNPDRGLATLHPCGHNWVGETYRNEPWFDFIGYQSSHAGDAKTQDWIQQGPPHRHYAEPPAKPVINLEPCYEAHIGWAAKSEFTPLDVRRAMIASLLASPTAGVTYGHHGIWPWTEQPERAMDHFGAGISIPWFEAVDAPGALSAGHIAAFFRQLAWWRLRPARSLLAEQPGADDPFKFVSASRTDDGRCVVVYLPAGGSIRLNLGDWRPERVRGFDPAAGAWCDAQLDGDVLRVEGAAAGDVDRLVVLQAS
ncbi:MAG TPA: DUF4038 domain-containing protein, partial [Limnochordia bacterium]|nr:DUF4038 domain-containing protein [Limnochordia bacterium]